MDKLKIIMPQEVHDLAASLEAKSGITLTENARKGLMVLIFNMSSTSGQTIFNRKFLFSLGSNYHAYLAKLKSKEAYLKEYFSEKRPSISGRLPLKLEDSEVKSIKEILLATGHLEESMYFTGFDDEKYEEYINLEDDEEGELLSELEKSRIARKKQDNGQINQAEYEQLRGRIWDPHTGREGYDPIEHLHFEAYVKNFDIIPSIVVSPTPSDFNLAVQDILKDDPKLAFKIIEEASKITAQRLAEQEANSRQSNVVHEKL